jgi:subtilisin family serine protease
MVRIDNTMMDILERRTLMAYSGYAQLVNQDDAIDVYSSITGTGTTVAVIDTGIDYTLRELGGGFGRRRKVIGGYDFFDNDADPIDTDGHGTATASVIAGNAFTYQGVTYQGVAPDAKLVALRVGDEEGIPDENVENALQWVINNHTKFNISVVNLSLGSGNYTNALQDSYSDEFAELRELGIFVVAASGNSKDGSSGPIRQDGVAYPAADANVYAVGAVDSSDVITRFTQRGDELDLLAPGLDIVVPRLGGGYEVVDGTSFASPYVAGTAALIKQADNSAQAGDIGSILSSSAAVNRDGDTEPGDTTGLLFGRLDITAALGLVSQRTGRSDTLKLGRAYDTALDAEGVLHAAYYDAQRGRLLYATRDIDGLWSRSYVIDQSANVGSELSINIDSTGKPAVAYFDSTNTAVKYAGFNGRTWNSTTLESRKHTGNNPTLAFDIDGNAYVAFYRRSGGLLQLATLNRDANTWSIQTIDGGNGVNVGRYASIDVGEAARRDGLFTRYDTQVAIAYADVTNGDLKYARIDLDETPATWERFIVDNTTGVSSIDLQLHAGPLRAGLQAQIGYIDSTERRVKYAYRNTNWFTETVAPSGRKGSGVNVYFDQNDNPRISYFNGTQRAIYTAARSSAGTWSTQRISTGSGLLSSAYNERENQTILTWINRARTSLRERVIV